MKREIRYDVEKLELREYVPKGKQLSENEFLPRLDSEEQKYLEWCMRGLNHRLQTDSEFCRKYVEALKALWKAQGQKIPRCREEAIAFYEAAVRSSHRCTWIQIIRGYTVMEVPSWDDWFSIPIYREVEWRAIWGCVIAHKFAYLLQIDFPELGKRLDVRFEIPEDGAKISALQRRTKLAVCKSLEDMSRGNLSKARGVILEHVPCEFLDGYDWVRAGFAAAHD